MLVLKSFITFVISYHIKNNNSYTQITKHLIIRQLGKVNKNTYFCVQELRIMTRKIFQLLSLGLILFGVTACKQEKKSNDIITKIAPKPKVPSGPQPMTDFKYEKKIEWMGSTYTIRIHRFADKSLSIVSDEDGRKYYDNKFQVQILRQDGSSFYERTLTKDDFREYTDNQYGKDGALIGFMFDRAEGNKLYFGASVGSPDPKSDEYVPLDVTIDNMSRMRISKATQLDTPSDQPQQQPKSELEKAEEEGV